MTESERLNQLQNDLIATRTERDKYHAELIDRRLAMLEITGSDHEKRLRLVEEVATKFNFLMALSIGGGLLSAIMLIRMLLTGQ